MTTPDMFSDVPHQPETVTFVPTRDAGLARLTTFASRTGAHYASQRNYDYGPKQRSSVSALSPWIRHRLITEEEVLTHTLARHSPEAATKFIQEVFWRGYFKGWLEHHPSVWDSYQSGILTARNGLERDIHRRSDYADAIQGRTGIACFDHWCEELTSTGYLHNHARMWFASIWIFTLRLPWELGADYFLNHLIDGDPASNTLSWRWVAGLHTKGKTYLARPSNIAKYTDGQFNPVGQLAQTADPLTEDIDHPVVPLTVKEEMLEQSYLMLITEEDCRPEDFVSRAPLGVLGLISDRDPHLSDQVKAFKKGAVHDAASRMGADSMVTVTHDFSTAIIEAAERAGTTHVITPWAPVGPVATQLAATQKEFAQVGIHLHQPRRAYDTLTWPHATKGFFKLKKQIPAILGDLRTAAP